MKKKSGVNSFIFFLNTLVALLLLGAYFLPFLSPINIPAIGIISLVFPIVYFINILFFLYWLLGLKKKAILSLIIVIVGFPYLNNIVKFSDKQVLLSDDVKVMSYNVRLLNYYNFIKDKETGDKIVKFVKDKNPDILAMQEYCTDTKLVFDFPYKHIKTQNPSSIFGLAIYSKYPIIKKGSLDFNSVANNSIFVDVIIKKDTVRVYNVHLESLKINPNKENFGEKSSEKLLSRMKHTFQQQAIQVEKILNHQSKWKGKSILMCDLNNTPFSWVYQKLTVKKKDAFEEAGKGFGKTYNHLFPLRIDYILTSPEIEVNHYKRFSVNYSDHYPIMARLNF